MKNIKLISLLILLAILSFSCKEDDYSNEEKKGDDDNKTKNSSLASDYIFEANKDYRYLVEAEYSHNPSENETYTAKIETFDFNTQNGKNSLRYIITGNESNERGSFYISAENSKLFGLNSIISLFPTFNLILYPEGMKPEDMDWFLCIDFENEEWEYEYELNDFQTTGEYNEVADIKYEVKGKRIGEVNYTFNEIDYTGIKFQTDSKIDFYTIDSDNDEVKFIINIEREVIFIKDIGMVESEYKMFFSLISWFGNENGRVDVIEKLTRID